MTSSPRLRLALSAALLAAALAACHRDPRPMTPLAKDFELVGLDGQHLKAGDLRGKPWVINFWIPG